jgi:hypothetical protein
VTLYRISLNIPESEHRAIEELAKKEVRPIRDQIRFMIKESLEQRGLLTNQECIEAKTKQEAVGCVS